MTKEQEDELIKEVRRHVIETSSLSLLSDDELENKIEESINKKLNGRYCAISQKISMAQQIYSGIRGLGILDSILKDNSITEVMINGPDQIFVERNGRVRKIEETFEDEKRLEDIIQRIVGAAGREVNQSSPIVDTRLADGSRVNVVLPPISLVGPAVTIRKFSKTPMTIGQLIKYGSITDEIAEVLRIFVEAKYNIFIAGGTGSGKTTFLNALSNYIPKDERIITIEDSAELQITGIENLVSLETRNANSSGAGQITIQDLIKSSLRMRPESIKIIQGKLKHNKKRFPIPGAFLQHVFGDLIPLIC